MRKQSSSDMVLTITMFTLLTFKPPWMLERKNTKQENKAPDGTKPRIMFHEEVLWELPFEVIPQFCDANGVETNDIMVEADDQGVEWAYVFMVSVHARKVEPAAPRIVRNRQRRRTSQENPAPRPAPQARPPPRGVPASASFDTAFVDTMDDDDL